MEAETDFIFLDSKITVDSAAVMKLRHLLLERKAMTNLDSILKSRHHFADKGPSSQSFGFSRLSTEGLMLLNCGVGEDS